MWFAHRRSLAHLREVDNPTTCSNLLLLSQVALMPVVIRFLLTDHAGAVSHALMMAYALATAATYGSLGLPGLYAGLAAHSPRHQASA